MRGAASGVKRRLYVFAAAAIAAFLIYAPSLRGGFVSDDLIYLEYNPTLRKPLGEALPALLAPYFANWAPLHHAFLYAEWQLFGMAPLGYRVANLLLFAACACALAGAARRAGLTAHAALLAAALLLLHPVAVEAVAWINQSKTLLALLFGLLALERWLAHLEEPSDWRLLAALGLAALSLLSKPALVLLPAVFAVALWTHGSPGGRRRELPPLAALGFLALGVLVLGMRAQASQGGIVAWYGGSPGATARVMPGVLWRYLRLALLPFDPVHGVDPPPIAHWADRRVWLPALGVLMAAAGAALAVRRQRRLALAAAWWGAALLPVVQLVPMTTVFADRYLVVALPGLLAPVAWGLDAALSRARAAGRAALALGIGVALAVFAALTARQAALWAEPERLYAAATAAYPDGRMGWIGLGAERQIQRDLPGAAQAYLRALRAERGQGYVWLLLGRVRLAQGRLGAALHDLDEGLRLAPRHPDAAWAREQTAALRAQGVRPEADEP